MTEKLNFRLTTSLGILMFTLPTLGTLTLRSQNVISKGPFFTGKGSSDIASAPLSATNSFPSTLKFRLANRRAKIMRRAEFDPLRIADQLESQIPDAIVRGALSVDESLLPADVITNVHQERLVEYDVLAVTAMLIYLTAKPGVLQGVVDSLLVSPLDRALEAARFRLKEKDIQIQDQLGSGGYGTVYKGTSGSDSLATRKEGIRTQKRRLTDLVVKKVRLTEEYARDAGDVEVYMNRRVARANPSSIAPFLGTINTGTTGSNTQQRWIVWKYAGDQTLEDIVKARNFPLNMEQMLFKDRLKGKSEEERRNLIIKKLMYKVISAVKGLHEIGVCHRDLKPENILITDDGDVRLIDLGASVDLRNGYNYKPNFTLLDPTFAAPEIFVMPENTPSAPPEPLAILLSPILWLVNKPDRFDMFSIGLVFLQMLMPRMRNRSGLKEFNNALKNCDLNIGEVRKSGRGGFEWNNLDEASLSLVSQMLCPKNRRISASSALRHPYFLKDLVAIL